jgi:hypothetical protein
LFSLFSSFDGDCQSGSFSIQRNREKISTRKFEAGVLTQPGPFASFRCDAAIRPDSGVKPTCRGHCPIDAFDPKATSLAGPEQLTKRSGLAAGSGSVPLLVMSLLPDEPMPQNLSDRLTMMPMVMACGPSSEGRACSTGPVLSSLIWPKAACCHIMREVPDDL